MPNHNKLESFALLMEIFFWKSCIMLLKETGYSLRTSLFSLRKGASLTQEPQNPISIENFEKLFEFYKAV